MKIRPVQTSDIDQAAEVLFRSWHESFIEHIPSEVLSRITKESTLAAWRYVLTNKNADLLNLAAFENERLIGTISCGRPREKLGADRELWAMHVDSQWQRKGVGRWLFEAAMDDCIQRGIGSLALCCIATNTKAIDFYKSMGGIVQSEKKQRDGFEEVVILWDRLQEKPRD